MIDLSHKPFFIFGCGNRPKFICTTRGLFSFSSRKYVVEFSPILFTVDAPSYTVTIEGSDGNLIRITEDAQSIRLMRNGQTECLAESNIRLPAFKGHPHSKYLRILHHEILTNISNSQPLPNFLVYRKAWYRDAAMICMVLEKTGNLDLVCDWIHSLRDPFDRNNAGHKEPDNLGQVLYMISLIDNASHPLVENILNAAKAISGNGHLNGPTDGAEHPVYQTKWLKFGLKQLGLTDDFRVPQIEDSYAPLFWWDKRDINADGRKRFHVGREKYPYLAWAEAHFFGDPPPFAFSAKDYPVTWESHASQADYSGMEFIDEKFVHRKLSMPHTWHAAEMFLFLHKNSQSG